MGWLKRLLGDDEGIEKLEDKYPTNTFLEIYILWLAVAVTILVIAIVAQIVLTWLGMA